MPSTTYINNVALMNGSSFNRALIPQASRSGRGGVYLTTTGYDIAQGSSDTNASATAVAITALANTYYRVTFRFTGSSSDAQGYEYKQRIGDMLVITTYVYDPSPAGNGSTWTFNNSSSGQWAFEDENYGVLATSENGRTIRVTEKTRTSIKVWTAWSPWWTFTMLGRGDSI